MKVWAGFLVLSFLLGGRAARTQAPERRWVVLLGSGLVATMLYSLRFA